MRMLALMRDGRAWAWVMMALSLGGLGGCVLKGGDEVEANEAHPRDIWRPAPVSLRVYPSTRFVLQDTAPVLEARLELMDEMGDPIKAAGEFQVELFADPGASHDAGRQLYAWRVEAWTLEQQRHFYDPITRTYLLRLKLDPEAIQEQPTMLLRAAFRPAQGRRLTAQATIRTER